MTTGKTLALAVLMFALIFPTNALAMSAAQRRIFDLGIPYYNVDDPGSTAPQGNNCVGGDGDISAPRPTALTGGDNETKVWNYFIARGLTPVAAAGAMGNIKGESGFDPFLTEAGGGGGWGLIQWTPATAFDNDKPDDTPDEVVAGATSGDSDLYLLWQLHALWLRGGDAFWANMNRETSVGSYTDPIPPANSNGQFLGDYRGQGSAYYFHAVIERSGDTDWGLDDATGEPNPSQNGHGNIRKRPFWAEHFLNQFGGNDQNCNGRESEFSGDGFEIYYQCDQPWRDVMFGSETVCDSGCGPTAMAMVITALTGVSVTPDMTATYGGQNGVAMPEGGSYWTLPEVLAGNADFGIKVEKVSSAVDAVNEVLNNGGMVWLCGNGAVPFTDVGHCIAVRGRTADGKWKLFDSANRNRGPDTEYDPAALMLDVNDGSVTAVYKK